MGTHREPLAEPGPPPFAVLWALSVGWPSPTRCHTPRNLSALGCRHFLGNNWCRLSRCIASAFISNRSPPQLTSLQFAQPPAPRNSMHAFQFPPPPQFPHPTAPRNSTRLVNSTRPLNSDVAPLRVIQHRLPIGHRLGLSIVTRAAPSSRRFVGSP